MPASFLHCCLFISYCSLLPGGGEPTCPLKAPKTVEIDHLFVCTFMAPCTDFALMLLKSFMNGLILAPATKVLTFKLF